MTSDPFEKDPDDQRAPQAPASLDPRTFLVGGVGPYMATMYPEAGEVVVVAQDPSRVPPLDTTDVGADLGSIGGDVACERSEAEQQAHDQENWERANRRSIAESRRYLVANRLRYMWVLTYAGEGLHGPVGRNVCMHDVAAFVRRFRQTFGDLPYWFSPELHPDGHGWHVNFFVAKRLKHAEMLKVWGQGHVWVSDWAQNRRVLGRGLNLVERIRLAAIYACKYAVKDWSPEVVGRGSHRYACAQHFQPIKAIKRFRSLNEALEWAHTIFWQPPATTWCSLDDPDWTGPPVWCLRWNNGVDPPESWGRGRG